MHRIAVVALLVSCSLSTPVAQQVKPRFEVASAKPQREPFTFASGAGAAATPRFRPGGVFNPTHATVESLVMFAYDVKQYQIDGGPDWMRRDTFQIDARAAADASADQIKLM